MVVVVIVEVEMVMLTAQGCEEGKRMFKWLFVRIELWNNEFRCDQWTIELMPDSARQMLEKLNPNRNGSSKFCLGVAVGPME